MNAKELYAVLIASIKKLYNNDFYLIEHNLSERSITHKLALYLTEQFSEHGFHIDCEYNGDVDNMNLRKKIFLLSHELEKIGRNQNNEDEIQSLSVFPDIIVHKRSENTSNLLVIEVKKNYPQRTIGDQFDKLKLEAYTSGHNNNHLKYKLGAYIEFDTLTKDQHCKIDFYDDGKLFDTIDIRL